MEDLHKTWGHRWLTPKARPTKSRIHGLGVMCIRRIRKGETICVYGGIIIPIKEIRKYRSMMGHAGIQIDDKFFVCPATREELGKTGIFNHSCEPNMGLSGPVMSVAIREIRAGEEITGDYAFMESCFKPFRCLCGSRNCRKIIRPTDWKKPEIRKKYGRYFSPYLKRKLGKIQ
ncbi:MAG: SET domain-containing protein-lysine N-methyltransferase [Candidatus Aenigmarchaeota archaeon]|nr:SET domain-containing protein-lysine N-methyltransferase [Candidatus Aenigmarchaeota archaeon]